MVACHFRCCGTGGSLGLLPRTSCVVTIGWPLSSWLDRLSITVRYINIMRLPRRFPCFEFIMRYMTKVPIGEKKVVAQKRAGKRPKEDRKTLTPSPWFRFRFQVRELRDA